MQHFSEHLVRTIRRRHGIVTTVQLRDDGLDTTAIGRLRDRGLLLSAHAGIFRVAGAPDTFASRCVVACDTNPGAPIAGAAAAALWDLDHVYRPHRPEQLVVGPPQHRVRGVNYRSTRLLDAADVHHRNDGICVLSRPRTWLDALVHVGDNADIFTTHVLDSQCDLDELWEVVDRWESTRRGRPGAAKRLLMSKRVWRRPATAGRAA